MTDVHFADIDDIKAYAEDIPERWAKCREDGHNLAPYDAQDMGDCFERTRRCRNCKTLRTQLISKLTGEVLHSSYKYPNGYTMPSGTGRISAQGNGIFRLANVAREMQTLHRGA